MKVVIQFDDGQYYLRRFGEAHSPDSYLAPDDWAAHAVDVPDHVVEAYYIARAQFAAVQTLLAHWDRITEVPS